MKKMQRSLLMLCLLMAAPSAMKAQQILNLEDCRQMAILSNRDMETARAKMEMADLDKKIAMSNWFPKISVTGTYMFNEKELSLIGDDMSKRLQNAGTALDGALHDTMGQLQQAILSNPQAAMEFMKSPLWQTVVGQLSKTQLADAVNKIGSEIDKAFHLDIQNVVVGVVSLQQPIFVGGKIVAANKIATLAQELSRAQYDQKYQDILIGVDQSYWQIVSIANKLKLSEQYADLLHKMEHDVEASIAAGIMTEADMLQIRVQVNEADMMATKAKNGLELSKMLLCKQIGLDLNSSITLADENTEDIAMPLLRETKDIEDIYKDRPEIKSLNLATQIYEKKVNVVRADMMPKIALTANYLISNPSSFNGFDTKWGGMFNVGVMVNIPIFHAFEAANKTRKAKTEASLYRLQLEDAKNMIDLQVTQCRKMIDEALEKVNMARNNMLNAEENLRTASIGYEAGVVTTNVALGAHTAWLKSHSEYIDACIELQMNNANLLKAEGAYARPTDIENEKQAKNK